MRGYKHLTTEQRAEVIRLYQETRRTATVHKATGYTHDQIRNALKRAGIELSKKKVTACHRHDALVRLLAHEGRSLSEIAGRVGANRRHLKDYLKEHGIAYAKFVQAGKNNPAWRGGQMIDKSGYVLLHMPSHPHANRHGYVREHRVVMEKHLGRFLEKGEVVHHIDENPQNNSPKNLRLYSRNADHLAETLQGRTPNWTPSGRAKLKTLLSRRDAAGRLLPSR